MHVSPERHPVPQRALAPSRANSLFFNRLSRAARSVASAALVAVMLAQPVAGAANGRIAQALPSAGAPASQYFAATNKSVSGTFLDTFRRYGLQAIGYPVSDVQQENGRAVQYFERVRMEMHPEAAAAGYGVMFSRLGDAMSRTAQPFGKVPQFASGRSSVYVRETGHSLSYGFLDYWKSHGGVQLFGYPISEPMRQDGMTVQWFERARFEYHPELASKGQSVQLTLLGKLAYDGTGRAAQQVAARPAQQTQQAPAKVKTSVKAPAPVAPAAQPAQVALNGMESYLFKAVNDQRAAAGLGSVQLNGAATDVARSRSTDMATRNYFSHTTPDGAQFFGMLSNQGVVYKYAGEILARNNYSDDQAAPVAIQSYLNSPPHKAIMLDGRYNAVGVGYAKSNEDGMHYFTVLFIQQ